MHFTFILEQIGWAVEMGNQRLMEVSRWKLTSNRSHLLWNEGNTTVNVIYLFAFVILWNKYLNE